MEQKKNTKFIVIIIILVILLSCSVGYIVYDNFIKEDEVVENNENQGNNDDDTQKNENDNELDDKLSADEIGKRLFKDIISIMDVDYPNYVFIPYDDNILNINNLGGSRMGTALKTFIGEDNINYNSNYNDSCIPKDVAESNFSDDCYYYKIDKNVFDKKYHELFGKNTQIAYEEIFLGTCEVTRLRDDKVYSYKVTGCGGANSGMPYLKYNRSVFKQNNLEVYVDYIFVEGFESDESNLDELFAENTITEYKLTFKKDTDNNYYWYSSEIVK